MATTARAPRKASAQKVSPETGSIDIKEIQSHMNTANAFVLEEEELAEVSGNRGRKAKPSVYLDLVKDLAEKHKPGTVVGIHPTPERDTFGKIHSQLRLAGKALGVSLKISNRLDKKSDKHPNGYVSVQVKPEDEKPAPKAE